MGEDVVVIIDIEYEIGVTLLCQADAFVIDEAAMLNRVHPVRMAPLIDSAP